MKLILLPLVAAPMLLFGVNDNNSQTISTSNEIVEVNDGNSVVVEETKEEKDFNWETFKDTYLVPMFSGISISSILGTVVSLVIAFVYKKAVKELKAKLESQNIDYREKALVIEEKVKATIEQVNTVLEFVKHERELTVEMKETVIAQTNAVVNKLAELTNTTEKLAEVKVIIAQLNEIIGKIAESNKELVANGTAEEINKLLEQLKNM